MLEWKKVKSSCKLKENKHILCFSKKYVRIRKSYSISHFVYICIESYIKLITNFKLQSDLKIHPVKPREKNHFEFTLIPHQRSKSKGITAGSCRKCKQIHVFVGRAVKYHAGSVTCHELFCIRFLQILYIIYMLLK